MRKKKMNALLNYVNASYKYYGEFYKNEVYYGEFYKNDVFCDGGICLCFFEWLNSKTIKIMWQNLSFMNFHIGEGYLSDFAVMFI